MILIKYLSLPRPSFKKVASSCTLSLLFFSTILLLLVPPRSHCLELDKDGGYSLVIALDKFDSEPDATSVENILSSIKGEFSNLSKWMYSTTGKFYIKHVDILLQSLSHFVKMDGVAKSKSYKNADIQISEKLKDMHVRNPNGCGIPGSGLGLPLKLFNDTSKPRNYGKTLLYSFAKFRWGIFEEHGIASDHERYPKFYKGFIEKDGMLKPSWIASNCVDNPLEGSFFSSYERLDGDSCDLQNLEREPEKCKFRLDPTKQNAKSSIMSYPEIDAVNTFCDKGTHNKLAPTPQNVLCKYQSVMEVIRNTKDWRTTDNAVTISKFVPTFKYFRTSDKPYLYLLLDRDFSSVSDDLLDKIGQELGRTFNYLDETVVTQIGRFPSSTTSGLEENSEVILPWSLASEVRRTAGKMIKEHFSSGTAVVNKGNVASALFEVSKTVQALNHPKGTVVVILKIGSGVQSRKRKNQHNFEHEIIASLKTANVSLHALEIQGNATAFGINLENVVKHVGGSHVILNGTQLDDKKFKGFIEGIKQKVGGNDDDDEEEDDYDRFAQESQDTVVVYKGYTNGTREGSTYHPGDSLNGLQVYLSSEFPLTSPVISMNNMEFSFEDGFEWNRDFGDDGFRYIHHSQLASVLGEQANGPVTVTWNCSFESCEAYLVILGEVDDKQKAEEVGYPELRVDISTSSLTNYFDWNVPQDSSNPFHIYAELFTDHFPSFQEYHHIRMELTGIVCSMDESPCQNYLMIDDGQGEPDILKNDGVYSFSFMPDHDGRYYVKIFCNVFSENELILTRTFDYDSILTFEGTDKFQPSIRRINDLRIAEKRDDTMELEWTAPIMYGSNGEELSAESYELRSAAAHDDLISAFEQCRSPKTKTDLPKPSKPGSRQTVKVDLDQEKDVYFAIRSLSSGMQSEASNLVSSAFVSPPPGMEPHKIVKSDKLEDNIPPDYHPNSTPASSNNTNNIIRDEKNTEFKTDDDHGHDESESSESFTEDAAIADSIFETESRDSNIGLTSAYPPALTATSKYDLNMPTQQPPSWINSLLDDISTESDIPSPTTEPDLSTTATFSTTSDEDDFTSTTTEDFTSTSENTSTDVPVSTSTTFPSTTSATTSSRRPPTTTRSPKDEQFFKKPIGYITAGVSGGFILIALGGTVGFLYWRRKQLIDSGRLILNRDV